MNVSMPKLKLLSLLFVSHLTNHCHSLQHPETLGHTPTTQVGGDLVGFCDHQEMGYSNNCNCVFAHSETVGNHNINPRGSIRFTPVFSTDFVCAKDMSYATYREYVAVCIQNAYNIYIYI